MRQNRGLESSTTSQVLTSFLHMLCIFITRIDSEKYLKHKYSLKQHIRILGQNKLEMVDIQFSKCCGRLLLRWFPMSPTLFMSFVSPSVLNNLFLTNNISQTWGVSLLWLGYKDCNFYFTSKLSPSLWVPTANNQQETEALSPTTGRKTNPAKTKWAQKWTFPRWAFRWNSCDWHLNYRLVRDPEEKDPLMQCLDSWTTETVR